MVAGAYGMEPYTAISSAGPGDMPAGAALIPTLFYVVQGDVVLRVPCFKKNGRRFQKGSPQGKRF
jgi:hypothetical protein